MHARASLIGVAVALLTAAPAARSQTLLTQQEALRLAFPPPATIERRTAYLTEEQESEVRERADVELSRSVVPYYVAWSDLGDALGVAWFDVHRVRTLAEVLMIVVSPEGRVRRIEVLKFAEPPEYLATERWLAQFRGENLDDDLTVGRAIINLTGATLTSRAVTAAVRRALALQAVIDPLQRKESGERDGLAVPGKSEPR